MKKQNLASVTKRPIKVLEKKQAPKLKQIACDTSCPVVNAYLEDCKADLCFPEWNVKVVPSDACVNRGTPLDLNYDIVVTRPSDNPQFCFNSRVSVSVGADSTSSVEVTEFEVKVTKNGSTETYNKVIALNPTVNIQAGKTRCFPIADCFELTSGCEDGDSYSINVVVLAENERITACSCQNITLSECADTRCFNLTTSVCSDPASSFTYKLNSITPQPAEAECGDLTNLYSVIQNGILPNFPTSGVEICSSCFDSSSTSSFTLSMLASSTGVIADGACPVVTEYATLIPIIDNVPSTDECRFIKSCKSPNIECKTPEIAVCPPVLKCTNNACVCKQSTLTAPPAPYCCNYTIGRWIKGNLLPIPDGAENLYIINLLCPPPKDPSYCLAPWNQPTGDSCVKCVLDTSDLRDQLGDVQGKGAIFYSQLLAALLNIQNSDCSASLLNGSNPEVYDCICNSYLTLIAAYTINCDLATVLVNLNNVPNISNFTECLTKFNENALVIRYDTEISNGDGSGCTLYMDLILSNVCPERTDYSYIVSFEYKCDDDLWEPVPDPQGSYSGSLVASGENCVIAQACDSNSLCYKNTVIIDYAALVDGLCPDGVLQLRATVKFFQGSYSLGTITNVSIPAKTPQICTSDVFTTTCTPGPCDSCAPDLLNNFDGIVTIIYLYLDPATQTWTEIPEEDQQDYADLIKLLLQNPGFHSLSEREWFLLSTYGQHYEIKIQSENCTGKCVIFENKFTLRTSVGSTCELPTICERGAKFREVSSTTYNGYQFPACD